MSIAYFEGKNSGGVKKIHIIRQSLATFDPSLALQPVTTYIDDISTSENWLTLLPLPDTARWQEDQSLDASTVYSYQVELVINKDRAAITEALHGKAAYKLLALVEDENGTVRLLGSDTHHCRLQFSQVKERGIVSPNLYRVTLSCQLPFPAVYYTGAYTGS